MTTLTTHEPIPRLLVEWHHTEPILTIIRRDSGGAPDGAVMLHRGDLTALVRWLHRDPRARNYLRDAVPCMREDAP